VSRDGLVIGWDRATKTVARSPVNITGYEPAESSGLTGERSPRGAVPGVAVNAPQGERFLA
jgi:hypothetical protein